jgi:flagella basal body P-ring formation protein FlgA
VGLLVVCGLLVAALPANAEEPAPALAAGLVDQVRSLALDKAAAPAAARVEVVVGQLDPRLHLAPCERIEPYLPANVRLWGKSRIGLRCTQGRTAWNVYLPIVVKVWGRALVVPGGAAAGSVLAEGDLDEPRSTSPRSSRRSSSTEARRRPHPRPGLRPGQAVRQAHIKSRQWFAAGEPSRSSPSATASRSKASARR